ncbi:adenylate kinase isoenzyme 6 isoform X2 [Nylanderia fulva]|nr:adenylate kinase isoenzyme 6 isoform X2 [Nylanderia fulva]
MAHMLSEKTGLTWLDVSQLAIENKCVDEYDEVYQCRTLDEDKLLDGMESAMNGGGIIVDYHSAELFPERWFDIVFVLRTDNTILYDRLEKRGYSGKKLQDNIECEIFQTILEEARSAYSKEIVHELFNDTFEQMTNNVDRICQLLEQWKINNQQT